MWRVARGGPSHTCRNSKWFSSLPQGNYKQAGSPLGPSQLILRFPLPHTFPTMAQSPPRQKTTALPHDSPVHVKEVHSSHSYQSDRLEEARVAVLHDLGPNIPMISFQTFLDYLAPPQPDFDLDATMQSLRLGSGESEPVLTSSNQWSQFPKTPKDSQGSEDSTFSPIPDIFTKVVVAIVANSGGNLKKENRTIDFLQNPSRAPTSTERRNESRPDGYFVRKDRVSLTKDGTREDILWADIALSCEYKKKDGHEDLDDVRTHRGF